MLRLQAECLLVQLSVYRICAESGKSMGESQKSSIHNFTSSFAGLSHHSIHRLSTSRYPPTSSDGCRMLTKAIHNSYISCHPLSYLSRMDVKRRVGRVENSNLRRTKL